MYNGPKRFQTRKWTSILISVVTQYEYHIEIRMKPSGSDVAFMFAFSSRNLNSEAGVALTLVVAGWDRSAERDWGRRDVTKRRPGESLKRNVYL